MPNTSAAKRELRVANIRHTHNKSVKSMTKTNITTAENLILSGDIETAKRAIATAISTLDKAAGKGVLHRNNASRRKARLIKKLNKATASPTAAKTPKEPVSN